MTLLDTNTAQSTEVVLASYGPKLIKELADARVALAQNTQLTAADEQRFAASWIKRRLNDIQSERLITGLEKLDQNVIGELRQFVLDAAFNGAQLWRVWQQYPQAANMWVNGTDRVSIELADGQIITVAPVAKTQRELLQAVRALRARSATPDSPWDHSNHALEFVIENDGTRVTAIDHVTTAQPFVTLRRPTYVKVTLDNLVANQTMSPQCAQLLELCVRSGLRILIAGSMNTGKTVLLRALAAALPKDWITVTVESQAELLIDVHAGDIYPEFVVSLEARKPGADGNGAVGLNQLIEDAQRMSPKCVIVGEVRGVEVNALSKSLLQGYQVMSTIHATSARHALDTAALYLEEFSNMQTDAALRRIATGLDIVVHMKTVNGKRFVNEVALIGDCRDGVVQHDLLVTDGQCIALDQLPTGLQQHFLAHGFEPGSAHDLAGEV